MKTYFTSDPHFGHARIIELCNRPFASVEEMNEVILERINATVSSSDRLVVLGDICLGKLDDSLSLLGRIEAAELVLVPGNHDRWSLAYEHRGDADAKREEFRARYEAQHPNCVVFADHAPSAWTFFDLTGDFEAFASPLADAWYSHYPFEGDSHGEDRAGWLRVEDRWGPVVHGHVHGEWKIKGRQFNVGVDVNDFTPVDEEELIEWIKEVSK